MRRDKIVQILITRGNKLFRQPREKIIQFAEDSEANKLLNNLKEFPHAFILGCVMDRQMEAKRAWLIPYRISQEIGGFEFKKLLRLGLGPLKGIFRKRTLHRFNNMMAENFYSAVQLIHNKYNDNASAIWKDNPKSATLIRRFLEFRGVGIKIATMAMNILARDFKISMQDRIYIDISPDIQVKRVFIRLGFIPKDASNDELIYCARELHPEYPGIFDFSAWRIGQELCRPRNPDCKNCYLNEYCPKNI